MRVTMPVVFGSSSFAPVLNTVETAIKNGDFPIELDCRDVVLVTSTFYTLIVGVLKRAGADKDRVWLINVGERAMSFIRSCKFDTVINIRMAE